jgi:hypothetical protein
MSVRVGAWSKAVCAISSEPGPIPPSGAAKTAANGRAVGPFFRDLPANLNLHLWRQVDRERERVVEIRDL